MEQVRPRGLLGRTRELEETDLALARSASGMPQTLLVGGDAGIGKTSLVVAVSDQARDRGFRVVTGHCLDIDTGVPLGPVREALHEVVLGRSDATLPPVTRRLAPLLRGHQAPGEAMSTDVLGDIRSSLLELAHEGPLMLVVEDMHWADRSTQDAAVMLAHTMRGPFVLMLTYRTEDVTRQHPFRHSLAEIGRGPGTRRIELGPLDEYSDRAGSSRTLPGAADRHLAISILDRSGGNPLFAEELLAGSDEGLPEYLNALLLARIDALTPDTRALIRLASVGGSRIQTTLLGQADSSFGTEGGCRAPGGSGRQCRVAVRKASSVPA